MESLSNNSSTRQLSLKKLGVHMCYIYRPSQPKTLPKVTVSGVQHKRAPVNHMIMPAAHSSEGVTWPAADYLHQVRRPGWLRRPGGGKALLEELVISIKSF